MRQSLTARAGSARTQLDGDGDGEHESDLTEREIRRDVLTAQGTELARLYADGTITAATFLRLQRTLDLELARYNDDNH